MNDTEIIHQFAVKNMLVERYLLGELSGTNRDDFERHMFECDTCFEAVKAGQAFTESLAIVYLRKGSPGLMVALWQRVRRFLAVQFSKAKREGPTLMISAICCGAPPPPGSRPPWFSIVLGIFVAGMALGVMLMAVLHRYAGRRKKSEFERLGNSIGGAIPARWNGRYPRDAERRS